MSGSCKGRRSQARAALFNGWEAPGWPLSSAIWTLAGNTATNSAAVAQAPKRRVRGSASSAAHATSHTPLTRAMVAQYTGMHESTVSRATAGKYVMIPSGKVIPFSDFFTPALNVKDVIKELIESEQAPLTDQEIMERLAEHGYHIARRTVAKYRDQLGILPSSLRN